MTLRERIEQDMREALKAREAGRLRLGVLRLVWSGVKSLELGGKGPADDTQVASVIRREIRQREEVLPEYERAGRAADVTRLREEIALLSSYLPQAATDEEIEATVRAVCQALGATTRRDMGRVMKEALGRLAGRAEGDRVRKAVEQALGT